MKEENLEPLKTQKLMEYYLYAEREPLRDDLLNMIDGTQPSVLQRKSIGDRLLKKVVNFVETFVEGMGRKVKCDPSTSSGTEVENGRLYVSIR